MCKLKRSLYGLKQSSRCWNATFREHMESMGYKQSAADPCVFSLIGEHGITIVAVYVNDLIVITKTEEDMLKIKSKLSTHFEMKDMGKLHYCLGVTVEQDKDQGNICMHQSNIF